MCVEFVNFGLKKVPCINYVVFNDVKKNSLNNDCQNQKGGECEYMNT